MRKPSAERRGGELDSARSAAAEGGRGAGAACPAIGPNSPTSRKASCGSPQSSSRAPKTRAPLGTTSRLASAASSTPAASHPREATA